MNFRGGLNFFVGSLARNSVRVKLNVTRNSELKDQYAAC